jgi:hypothetical protein
MEEENSPPSSEDEDEPDPSNSAFRRAIDGVFRKAAKRAQVHADEAAHRGRKARGRADDAGTRQRRR